MSVVPSQRRKELYTSSSKTGYASPRWRSPTKLRWRKGVEVLRVPRCPEPHVRRSTSTRRPRKVPEKGFFVGPRTEDNRFGGVRLPSGCVLPNGRVTSWTRESQPRTRFPWGVESTSSERKGTSLQVLVSTCSAGSIQVKVSVGGTRKGFWRGFPGEPDTVRPRPVDWDRMEGDRGVGGNRSQPRGETRVLN